MSANCDTQINTSDAQASPETCCPVEKSATQNCCPVEAAEDMWKKIFFCSMKEVKRDILKEKIKKKWGPMMEKMADATVEAMGVHWESTLAQANAKKGLRENIANIFQSARK